MKEEKLKALIKKGKLETSSDFTDQLMEKIALQQQKKVVVWPFKIVFGTITFLIACLNYVVFTNFDIMMSLLDMSLKNLKMPLVFGIFVFLFFVLNHILRLHETYKNMEKGMGSV